MPRKPSIAGRLRVLLALAALATTTELTGCASLPQPQNLQGEGLGSTWSVKLAGPVKLDLPTLQRGIQQQIDSAAHQLSRWDPKSNLSLLNASQSADWQTLPPELFAAVSYALTLASDTGGAYDPTVAPLVDAWGFGIAGRRFDPPSPEAISAARAHVGWEQIKLDATTSRVRRPAGVQLDLSSMAHGFGADQVAGYLLSLGLQRYLVDVGSEIRAQGNSPEGRPWRVAVEQPPPDFSAKADRPTETIRVLSLNNAAVATSGNYRYFFDYNGRRYSHRIDPRTAAPITHPLASVTVVAPECTHADALATALTVLGPDQGLDYAERHNIAALFIVRTSDGLEQRVTAEFNRYLD